MVWSLCDSRSSTTSGIIASLPPLLPDPTDF